MAPREPYWNSVSCCVSRTDIAYGAPLSRYDRATSHRSPVPTVSTFVPATQLQRWVYLYEVRLKLYQQHSTDVGYVCTSIIWRESSITSTEGCTCG
eukprot:3314299-Rhodomonas_salina.2